MAGRDLTEVLDPRRIVETRTAEGGAAPPVVEQMAADCRRRAGEFARLAAGRTAGFTEAERMLLTTAGAFATGSPAREVP